MPTSSHRHFIRSSAILDCQLFIDSKQNYYENIQIPHDQVVKTIQVCGSLHLSWEKKASLKIQVGHFWCQKSPYWIVWSAILGNYVAKDRHRDPKLIYSKTAWSGIWIWLINILDYICEWNKKAKHLATLFSEEPGRELPDRCATKMMAIGTV